MRLARAVGIGLAAGAVLALVWPWHRRHRHLGRVSRCAVLAAEIEALRRELEP